ncbi:MAG: UDP-N-acetylmuramoyl-L-alanine--D-glutamate ligase [Tidjanibacter sp.]|nr:UDP-N-acetylmuramoyl-L-alanine--D-glutamate ligase [Tidjanibacter sp.]
MNDSKQQRVVILGGGESGYGSAVLAKSKGFDTFLSDAGTLSDKYRTLLDQEGIDYEEGGHTEEKILSADLIVKSPGIPEKAPIVRLLRQQGVKIVSEIEFARPFSSGRTICITGSNGKTTTTTLTHRILAEAGYNVAVGGNIGESYARTVAKEDKEWYVLELSSFQLDGCYDFGADVAVLMNITPDHLDRYDYVFQNYIASKMRITNNQSPEGHFIYCGDDKVILGEVAKQSPAAESHPFGRCNIADGVATVCLGERKVAIELDRLHIKGLHNAYNAMAATLAALAAGVAEEQILSTLYSFEGVEHRLERVCEIDGVEWINDSKATNVDSVWYALESMKRPTIWIAGGTDKGNDYEPLMEFVGKKVKVLVCMGLNNSKLIDNFNGIVPVYNTSSLDEAVEVCRQVAQSGDTVLLSPACASFDLFRNYEERGRLFKAKVLEMAQNK